jgi:hypothetical protein
MWPVSAWKYERHDMASTRIQHTEDEHEDTIQPAVLAVFNSFFFEQVSIMAVSWR